MKRGLKLGNASDPRLLVMATESSPCASFVHIASSQRSERYIRAAVGSVAPACRAW